MKNYVIIYFCLLTILSSTVTANEIWQNHLEQGLNYFSGNQYEEASIEFDQVLNCMSELDNQIFPFVLFKLSECNFF